jgi:nucleotide-binding universal stress UspA family protein
MQPFRNILVAVSGGASRGLLDYAAMIGCWDPGARVHLVHVLTHESRCTATEDIQACVPRSLARAGLSMITGDRLDALIAHARQIGADVILLGSRAAPRHRRSLARRLAMSAPCSIWLIPDGSPPTLDRILVPVDYSERSADALAVATSIAAAAGLEDCAALHVRFNPAVATFEEYEEIAMADDREAFDIFVARIDLNGVDVTPLYEEGANVATVIGRVASRRQCDLVVMGTRGRSPAASVLLGSETDQVIRETQRPVLAVKHYGASLHLKDALPEVLR